MTNKRLLIIDDEERIRELVQACLEDLGGWDTVTAASGEEGLKIALKEPVDAILLDLSMPDMDGLTVYKQLQANSITQLIPVIILTAKVLPSERSRFVKTGIAGIISKPFQPLTICQEIAKILGW
ncbi:response regulator [Sphaerospermopsis aphanizomenoides BCCUSP55]|uniref:response regulator n=1 Tax=Sphaerospermopsis aphanizomenoides TaxID=459663 RepID=UPI001905F9DC|nr:response regulator [Sphaerospermopsis aphanizomenoides]MBK1990677.1 response regulator [Sphaerospermopsis aphanizomenoides BCCUSP55]